MGERYAEGQDYKDYKDKVLSILAEGWRWHGSIESVRAMTISRRGEQESWKLKII